MAPFIINLLFLVMPIGSVVFFVVSLCRYIYVKHKIRQLPCAFSRAEVKNRRNLLIISSVILVIFFILIAFLISILSQAVAYM